jgi:hypothetical protein
LEKHVPGVGSVPPLMTMVLAEIDASVGYWS